MSSGLGYKYTFGSHEKIVFKAMRFDEITKVVRERERREGKGTVGTQHQEYLSSWSQDGC